MPSGSFAVEPGPEKGTLKPIFQGPGPSLCDIMESSTSATGSSELGLKEIKTPLKQDTELA